MPMQVQQSATTVVPASCELLRDATTDFISSPTANDSDRPKTPREDSDVAESRHVSTYNEVNMD